MVALLSIQILLAVFIGLIICVRGTIGYRAREIQWKVDANLLNAWLLTPFFTTSSIPFLVRCKKEDIGSELVWE
jgi:hypothetical protein